MTKNDFLTKLKTILDKNDISDADEIVSEYEEHFAFKLADGYTEEEICAKLGDPEQIASQYEKFDSNDVKRSPFLTKLGLGIVDVFAGFFFILLTACAIVIAAAAIACAAVGICLILGINPGGLIPPFPYWCGAIIGISVLALGVLAACGCVYYLALMKQIFRSFARFQHNTLAAAKGKPALPPLPIHANLSPKTKRRLRKVALVALLAFAVCFILGFIACALSAGQFQFWHAWGWFGAGN